jgi:hypothetical protein
MYLGAYHFDGSVPELLDAYERLMATFPPETLDLHVCVVRDGGLTVFDACPAAEVFVGFSTSAEFRAAVGAAGLPEPRVEPIGEVHAARVRAGVAP